MSDSYHPGQWGQATDDIYNNELPPSEFRDGLQMQQDLIDYYQGLIFEKMEDRNGVGLYFVKIQSFLGNENRYIIAVVPNDFYQIGSRARLENLPFTGIQTRTLELDHNISPQQHHKKLKHIISRCVLRIARSTHERSDYYCPTSPIDVVLLHNIRVKSQNQYPDTIQLQQALESYQCVMSFK